MKWMLVFTALILTLSKVALAGDDLCGKDHHVDHKPRADVTYNPNNVSSQRRLGSNYNITEDSSFRWNDKEKIDIPITVDLVDRYGLDMPAGVDLDVPLGFISVYKDGRILHDGKNISGDIKDKCDEQQTSEDSDQSNTGSELPGLVSGGDQGR